MREACPLSGKLAIRRARSARSGGKAERGPAPVIATSSGTDKAQKAVGESRATPRPKAMTSRQGKAAGGFVTPAAAEGL